jgi:ferric-dicitrate binding protein FerR (iron transport regulator)
MQKKLIRKHLSGDCSFEEEQQALKILSTNEGLKILNDLADEFWEGELSNDKIDDKRLYQRITSKLPKKQIIDWTYMRYAASVVILALAAFTIINITHKEESVIVSVPLEIITKSTSKGQKSTIMLSDGSKVILNALSTLSYSRNFTDSTRNLKLTGEAFFYVAKEKDRPFTVTTGNTKTTALGTSFNINSRTSTQQISLATGKVLIKTDKTDAFILTPGEALEVNTEGKGAIRKFQFDVDKELSWKDGILYFKDNSFDDIVQTLEMWYNVKIELSSIKSNKSNYTGQFKNASLRHVLESMSFALDFEYTLKEKNIIIMFNQNPK